MNSAATAHTGTLHPFQYGCRYRPFHGGDVAAAEAAGISVQIVPASETPADFHYIIRTAKALPRDLRDHFDLELA